MRIQTPSLTNELLAGGQRCLPVFMSVVLGLDLSSASTGYAVLDGYGTVLEYGLIKLKHDTHGERLVEFEIQLLSVLHKWNPTLIVIEEVWRGPNPKTFKILAYYHGVAQKVIYGWNRSNAVYLMPTEARAMVGEKYRVKLVGKKKKKGKKAKGKDSKELAFNFVKKHFDYKDFTFKTHNDITDAIVLGLAGLEREAKSE